MRRTGPRACESPYGGTMSRIVIVGGHGKVALLLAPLLVARGDEVRSFIRDPRHRDAVAGTGATPVLADVEKLDGADLAQLLAGSDAVVWAAGAGGGHPARTYAVDRDAAIRSMDAAARAAADRYVMVSYLGSRADHGLSPDDPFFAYAEAKAAADAHLRASYLDATVLGPGTLTLDPPTGRIAIDPAPGARVGRADVAAVVAASLADDATIGRTIGFGAGDVPIADALAG